MADLEAHYLQVQTTTGCRAEAMELSRVAVEARLAAFLTERHSRDEPEIVALPIMIGSATHLNWMHDETRPVGGALR